jgi:flagellin
MSYGDLSRINTNVQSLGALHQLQKTNASLGQRQMRLATGVRINQAEDDSAGFAITKKLEAKTRGQAQALANIGDAKGMLTVGEGALNTVMSVLQTMKEKTIQAANDTMGADERDQIQNQIAALRSEVGDILGYTEFNGTSLFAAGGTSFTFQVNAQDGDTFKAVLDGIAVGSVGAANLNSISVNGTGSAGATARQSAISTIDTAISAVADNLAKIGDSQMRLTFKQENLNTSMVNYESSKSRIMDADFAKEQMNIVKMQILQQTGIATLAQANSAPQSVLSLL